MARATSEDAAAGLPDETFPPEDVELGLFDPSPLELPPAERIERARRAEAAALEVPGIDNSQGASWGSGEGSLLLANTRGFMGGYRTSSVSLSVVPQAERDGQMERDHWYTTGRGLAGPREPRAGGAQGRGAHAAAARRAAGEDRRGAGGVRSRDRGRDPGHAVRGDLGLRRVPQRDLPEGPPRAAGRLAARHAGRRRPPHARPRLAPVRRRGPADAAQPADRSGRAALLAVRRVLRAQDRGEADGHGAARRRRRPGGGRVEPLLRARARARPRRSSPRPGAGSTSPTSSAPA